MVLLQAFVPELASLRQAAIHPSRGSVVACGLQCEVSATIAPRAGGRNASSFRVLVGGGVSATVGVDWARKLVFVDGGPLGAGAVRAGPLYGDAAAAVRVHAIIDHSLVCVIFNNRTSLTVAVAPPSAASTGVRLGAGVRATLWPLAAANANEHRTNATWLTPQIHNIPPCL
eukprot:COSAG04_NODE_5027_length_1777_cov_1.078665_2_plen_172_part_00